MENFQKWDQVKAEWREGIWSISKIPELSGNLEVDPLILSERGEFPVVGICTAPGQCWKQTLWMCSHPISRLLHHSALWCVCEMSELAPALHRCAFLYPCTQDATHVGLDFMTTESERDWSVSVSLQMREIRAFSVKVWNPQSTGYPTNKELPQLLSDKMVRETKCQTGQN